MLVEKSIIIKQKVRKEEDKNGENITARHNTKNFSCILAKY